MPGGLVTGGLESIGLGVAGCPPNALVACLCPNMLAGGGAPDELEPPAAPNRLSGAEDEDDVPGAGGNAEGLMPPKTLGVDDVTLGRVGSSNVDDAKVGGGIPSPPAAGVVAGRAGSAFACASRGLPKKLGIDAPASGIFSDNEAESLDADSDDEDAGGFPKIEVDDPCPNMEPPGCPKIEGVFVPAAAAATGVGAARPPNVDKRGGVFGRLVPASLSSSSGFKGSTATGDLGEAAGFLPLLIPSWSDSSSSFETALASGELRVGRVLGRPRPRPNGEGDERLAPAAGFVGVSEASSVTRMAGVSG